MMKPPASSNTISSSSSSGSSKKTNDKTKEVGRPQKSDDEVSEKTIKNKENI